MTRKAVVGNKCKINGIIKTTTKDEFCVYTDQGCFFVEVVLNDAQDCMYNSIKVKPEDDLLKGHSNLHVTMIDEVRNSHFIVSRKSSNDLLMIERSSKLYHHLNNYANPQTMSFDEIKAFKKFPDFDIITRPFYIVKTTKSIQVANVNTHQLIFLFPCTTIVNFDNHPCINMLEIAMNQRKDISIMVLTGDQKDGY
jgi:uncharacterized protein (DUF1684 family)